MKTITTHYINGAFVESHGREVMDIIKPTNGQVIGRVTLADEEDTRRAIAAAKTAFTSFGRSTKEERAKILRRLHQAASARLDDLTAAMVEEYGGVVQFAGLIVQSGINAFLAAEQGLDELPLTRSWGKTTVTLEPVGVAGLITAWNANTLFICLKLASAVAAGCTVVVKPSELSSIQTQVLIEALHEADLPKGLLNVVTGLGNVVGAELVRNPDVAKISFTGSVGVGETIMRDGAATMKRVTLELGGKSPTILLDDAVFDQAIPSALVMAFLNSGQACAAGTRLLVPKSENRCGNEMDTQKRKKKRYSWPPCFRSNSMISSRSARLFSLNLSQVLIDEPAGGSGMEEFTTAAKGVLPRLSLAFTSAPLASSSSATSRIRPRAA
jgi:aldehyde dehydrogenase (NAD+)